MEGKGGKGSGREGKGGEREKEGKRKKREGTLYKLWAKPVLSPQLSKARSLLLISITFGKPKKQGSQGSQDIERQVDSLCYPILSREGTPTHQG